HHPFRFEKVELQLLTDEILDAYSSASKLRSAEELLHFWKRTMRLTVLRQGPPGSQWLNRFAEQQIMLKRPGLVRQGWYHGRPFIVTQNDYSLGIFNGDTGVVLLSSGGELEAHVESGSGVKIFSPGQLAHIEPAYFLTVHKSQGSEFDHVQLILPPTDTPILSRELIYTAISRARKSFTLKGEMKLFLKGAGRKTVRFTGL
ncbi:MAG TPA: ATP-binding domain-containing protein, partial [Balneolaceae bacterium]|nr:ATP-binding domain-containing protein [Balneolaceae bacterium]